MKLKLSLELQHDVDWRKMATEKNGLLLFVICSQFVGDIMGNNTV